MKQFLLIASLIIAGCSAFASVGASSWRWRKDAGPEHLNAPAGTNENVPVGISGMDSVIRLRIQFYNHETANYNVYHSIPTGLFYSTDSVLWVKITTDTSNAFALSHLDSVTPSAGTTQQLTNTYPSAFVPGIITDETTDTTKVVSINQHQNTEYEWILKPTRHVITGRKYVFKSALPRFGLPSSYTSAYPSLTVAGVLPVTFTTFRVWQDNIQTHIVWSTAGEQNTDRYEVWRSPDAVGWQLISTTKAKNSAGANTYQVNDEHPLRGKNYYQVRQYDKEGFPANTSIQMLTFGEIKQAPAVFIYGNPVTGSNIKLQIPGFTGWFAAVMVNTEGQVVHRQDIAKWDANAVCTLHLTTKLAAGIYYLNLKGAGFSQTVKVVIQ